MTNAEFQARADVFQAEFMKLFNAHTALVKGNTEESKKYREYIARLGAIQTNESIDRDEKEAQLLEEQEFGDMSYIAEDLAGDDQDLFENLFEAISKQERILALVDIVNNPPKKPRSRKARAAAAA